MTGYTSSAWGAYGDGRIHAIACPVPTHQGDNDSGRSCRVQLVDAAAGKWMLKCWRGCTYGEIAAALGLDLRLRSTSNAPYLVCSYEHPDGKPREVYRKDWPQDWPNTQRCPFPKCKTPTLDPHKHVWGYGSAAGTSLLLWGDDQADNELAIVEGEKAAAALVDYGANDAGFTPVTWRGGTDTVLKVNFDRVRGRAVVLMPDADSSGAGSKAMDQAAQRCIEAGAKTLRRVQVDGLPYRKPDKGDAADLPADAALDALKNAQAYAPPEAPAARVQPPAAPAKVPDWLKPDLERLLLDDESVQNPDADAKRYLRECGAQTLLVNDIGGQRGSADWQLYSLDEQTGMWSGVAGIETAMMKQAETAHAAIMASVGPGGRLPSRALKYIGKLARSDTARTNALYSVPTTIRLSTREGQDGYGAVQVAEENLDPVGRYIGCANGVVDLKAGRLLPVDEGKHKAVTLSTGIAYKPKARHPHVDALFAHLDDATAEYLKAVLGQGLYGMPDDIQLVITGPGNGGKTTLLEAVKAAVGPSHFGTASADVFASAGRYSGGSHTEDKRAIYMMRYCQIGEAERARVDVGKAKQATSGSAPFRGLHQKQETRDARALIIWVANRMPKIGMDDPAVQRRTRIVDYPQIPEDQRDEAIKRSFRSRDTAAAEAMLALLVEYANRYPLGKLPPVPESILSAVEREIANARNEFSVWVNETLKPAPAHERVAVQDLWDMWARHNGETATDNPMQTIGDVRRREFGGLVSQLFGDGLEPPSHARMPGHTSSVRAWRGVRLADGAHYIPMGINGDEASAPALPAKTAADYTAEAERLRAEGDEDGANAAMRDAVAALEANGQLRRELPPG